MKSMLNQMASLRSRHLNTLVQGLTFVLLVLSVSAQADVSKVENYDFELTSGGRLKVENVNGDITITGGPGNEVHVIATKRAGSQKYLDELEIQVHASDDRISISTRHPKQEDRWFGWGNDGNGSVSYEIIAPFDANLDSIETVNGEIEIAGISGDVSADTTNGDIQVSDLKGSLDADTVNGGVHATFESLGGNQRVVAETVNGRITLRLPADASASIDASTVNGGIDADDFGLQVDKGFLGRDLSGDIGGGDARIKVSTVNGSIKIRKN